MSIKQTALDTLHVLSRWAWLEAARATGKPTRRDNNKHIALFAWALPPNSNAGVYRPLSFIRHGSGFGWRFDTFHGVAPENQREHGEELLARIPIEVSSHALISSKRAPSYRFSPQIDGGFKNAIALAEKAITQLSSDPPDIVLASGPPFQVFVAAYFVAGYFGSPLVLDYRDEWTECPFDFVDKGLHDRYWEKRCLSAADAVFFTTQSHIEHQLNCFPELTRTKTYLIPNGWEPDDFFAPDVPVLDRESAERNFFNLAHVGNLAGHTPPHNFLAALGELLTRDAYWRKRLVVSFVGRRSPEAALALANFPFQDNLKIIDHVGKQEANRLMQKADCLLLISVSDLERYMPGKLFDYVAAGRPILAFGSPGEASSVIQKLDIGVLCRAGPESDLGSALNLLSQNNSSVPTTGTTQWLENHQRKKIAATAFEILSTVRRC